MSYLEFEAMGLSEIKTEISVSYVDHNTLQDGFENADDHAYLQSIAAKYGLYFSKAGNGICHQVHLEQFAKPGKTLLGSDSHTPTAGGMASLAIGAGGLDVAVAMAGGPFYLPTPRVINIELLGKLQPYVTAKDIILKVLQILTTKGNVGYIAEYTGPGVKTLSVPERATITNMGAELGVTTSIFPSDEVTRAFLKAQGREQDWIELLPDTDAVYDKTLTIDLNALEPMIALPHSPDNVKTVREVAGKPVDQVLIGSCTNSSYKDLVTVAELLDKKTVSPNLSFAVAPGSQQVLDMITTEGYLIKIIRAGGRILESACGFCIGLGQSPRSNAVSLRTNNRNFIGRSGTDSAQVYLVSPETAAASVLTGVISDPRVVFDGKKVSYKEPVKFASTRSLLLAPLAKKDRDAVIIFKGDNIGEPPTNTVLPTQIEGVVTLKVGDKITTDHIMPAGPFLKYRSNIAKYSEVVFKNVDATFATRAIINKQKGVANIIVGGLSYGQGSSREHAAICPMFLGVKIVLVISIERIHRANLINFGVVPLSFDNPLDYDRLEAGDELFIDNIRLQLRQPLVSIQDKTKKTTFQAKADFSNREIDYLFAGGKLNVLKE
jgi:aconitate hydratase